MAFSPCRFTRSACGDRAWDALASGCALLRVSATGSCRDTHTQHHQREGEETLVDASEPLPADEQPREGAKPSEGPLYSIALSIVVLVCEHGPSALGSPACRPSLGRNTHPDPTPTQRAAKRATIISPIRDQFLWTPPGTPAWPPHTDSVQRLLRQPYLRPIGARQQEAER